MLERPTIFWGYSLSDAGVLQALHPQISQDREHSFKWILVKDKNDIESINYFKAFNFKIIIADTNDFLEYISAINLHKIEANHLNTGDMFPQNVVPEVTHAPVRSVEKFFLGMPASWYDIFYSRIPRLSYYDKIYDAICGGSDVMVIGMPGCGKTTLMMQLASGAKINKHILVLTAPTREKSNQILLKLNGDPCLAFVDNISSDIDGFSVLFNAQNVQVVGFERDYMFDVIYYRGYEKKYLLFTITDLCDADIQKVYEAMPTNIRKNIMGIPKTSGNTRPSIFEVVEENIRLPSIAKRFRDVMGQLKQEDVVLLDTLIMLCYVHNCRTPVSFDMAFSFLRDNIASYQDIFIIIERLKSLVSDYEGILVDSEQDHFMPRSQIVAEEILHLVKSNDLKRVLLKFHENVSRIRVCQYGIFRHKAYDADIVARAFSDWTEGVSFYKKILLFDNNPYIKQQLSLYLLKKERLSDAFYWIDEAISQTRWRVFIIRNTYAVILFAANVVKDPGNPTVRSTLMESMSIISECYMYDRRKTYHAIKFAEQSMKFYNIYPDEVGLGYIKNAYRWLKEENNKIPWHTGIKRMFKKIESRYYEIS